jgi:uncharacterized protein (DUF488 family)
MITRQKVLLSILREAEGKASRMQVTKWAFLLRHETDSRGGSAFYEFLPYKYGPFSFCLFQESSGLVQSGLLKEVDEKTWALESDGMAVAVELDPLIQTEIRRVVHDPARQSLSKLTAYVYDHYPWFTLNSDRDRRIERPIATPAVYTAGYEGVSLDGFLNGLLRAGIERIVDVRNNPVSRRYGFHRATLARVARLVGIDYVHHPELGVPAEARQRLDAPGGYERLFRFYETEVLEKRAGSVEAVSKLISERPSVLLCREADPACCHRSRLATCLQAATGLDVRHLEIAG